MKRNMTIKELYNNLKEAYSQENLNKITSQLILLHKNKNYGTICSYVKKINKYISINAVNESKYFSKLIVLYHPDRGDLIRKNLKDLYLQNDYENLNKYAHIHSVLEIENEYIETLDDSIDYNPEYYWDADIDDDFNVYTECDLFDNQPDIYDFDNSFYNILRIREYGRNNLDIPNYLFEDCEEFEMAYSGIESLDGIEYCRQIKILDVSNNDISDIRNLWDLQNLEELYLANNQIEDIETLSNLSLLRVLDLSTNLIEDISPLFNMSNLKYVNLIGNFIPEYQIETLSKNGVVITVE